MFAVIGLGNPGSEYDGTRHNVGFAVIDAIAESLGITLRSGNGEYVVASKVLESQELLLMQPRMYMNNSGYAVGEFVEHYNLSRHQLLVVVDDFHLPLGVLRLRLKGSDGGHNGLYSIAYHLQADDYPRLRCGIKGNTIPAQKKELATYVLSPFDLDEHATVNKMIEHARDTAIVAAIETVETAINRFIGLVA